jgi:protein-tyrosine phosphatase
MSQYSILFVCTDNLCRSPTAEVVFRYKLGQHGLTDQIHVESAATHDFNAGEPVDIRAQKHAIRRDYDLSKFRARLVQSEDFERFDLLIAMDESNLLSLRMRCPPKFAGKLHHFREYCRDQTALDVPDPFYGEADDFEYVLDLVEDASEGLLQSGVWLRREDEH